MGTCNFCYPENVDPLRRHPQLLANLLLLKPTKAKKKRKKEKRKKNKSTLKFIEIL